MSGRGFIQKNPEEGSPCKNFFCRGHYVIAHQEGSCTCFLGHPPCGWCVDTTLRCDKCEEEADG